MKEPKFKSVIIVPHSDDCRAKGKKWSGVVVGKYYGNFRANERAKIFNHHLWYRVLCNDPLCGGTKAIHSWVLTNA